MVPAPHTNAGAPGGQEPPRVLTAGATKIAQAPGALGKPDDGARPASGPTWNVLLLFCVLCGVESRAVPNILLLLCVFGWPSGP